jgi:hypothetical protein
VQSKCSSTPFVSSHRLEVDDFAPDLETLRRVVHLYFCWFRHGATRTRDLEARTTPLVFYCGRVV